MIHPTCILEIGTYTGYSALCLAEGLQNNGELHTIDCDEELYDFQRKYFDRSEYGKLIIQHIGTALNVIPSLNKTFDLVFIDADKHNYPNIALGYAHNSDSAFMIWAFNKIFGSNAWISTLTGRFGLSEAVRKTIPDEAEVIQEAYNFEQKHKNLFIGKSVTDIALLFSLDNLMYNGCEQSNYSQPWHDITKELLKRNLQFDVVIDIPSAAKKPLLILCNLDCISAKLAKKLHDYLQEGGTIIATGLLGCRDEHGVIKEKQFMADYGVEIRDIQCDWNIPTKYLFNTVFKFLG